MTWVRLIVSFLSSLVEIENQGKQVPSRALLRITEEVFG